MKTENGNRVYTIGCNVNEKLLEEIRKHIESIEDKNIRDSIRIANLRGLSREDLKAQVVDNFIFDSPDPDNIDIAKELKRTNGDIASTAVMYYKDKTEAMRVVYDTIEKNDMFVEPAYINVDNEEGFNQTIYYFEKQIENAYKRTIEIVKSKEVEEKREDVIETEDMKLAQEMSEIRESMPVYEPEEKEITGDVMLNDMASEIKQATEQKDMYTGKVHLKDVTEISSLLAHVMGYDAKSVAIVEYMAQFHDIGKIVTPNEVLKYRGNLGSEEKKAEKSVMDSHALDGAELLKNMFEQRMGGNISPELQEMLDRIVKGVANHHVDYKKETEHDDLVDILRVADSFDAATSDRGYNLPKTLGDMVTDLAFSAGGQFSPKVSAKFIEYLTGDKIGNRDIEEYLQKYKELFIDRNDSVDVIKTKLQAQASLVSPEKKKEFEDATGCKFVTMEERAKNYSDRFNPNFRGDINKFNALKEFLQEQGIEVNTEMLSKEEYDKRHGDIPIEEVVKKDKKGLFEGLQSLFSKKEEQEIIEAKDNEDGIVTSKSNSLQEQLSGQVNTIEEIASNTKESGLNNERSIEESEKDEII